MRIRVLALLIGLATIAAGQGFPGAKADPISSGTSSAAAGFGPLLNVLIALGIVYALLRFAMPKVMSRLNKRLVTDVSGGIRIEESASFAGGNLYIVRARNRELLLSVSTQGVRCLADLSEAKPEPEPPTFGDLVEREMRTRETRPANSHEDLLPYEHRARERSSETATSPDGISEALRRLERLAH